jgi:hypothetical protein
MTRGQISAHNKTQNKMNNEKEYIEQYIDDSSTERSEGTAIIRDNPGVAFIDNEPLGACWSVKAFKVCVEKIEADSVVVGLYLGGTRIATATLNAKTPCVKINESVGGDALKVDANVCADFANRELRAKGKVCAFFACVKFNQRILKW